MLCMCDRQQSVSIKRFKVIFRRKDDLIDEGQVVEKAFWNEKTDLFMWGRVYVVLHIWRLN